MAKDVRRALMIASEPLKVPSTYASMDPDARAAWKTDQMAREGHGSFSPPGTPEREENFNRWHGNSKIRDGEGNPLRLYHATPKSFDTFLPGGPNPANEMPSGPATWLSPYPDKQPAGHHVGGFEDKFKSGANVMPVHADIRNPLVIDNKTMRDWARQSYAKGSGEFPLLISPESRKMLLEDGYDGILWAGFDATSKDEAFYDDHGIGEHPSKDEEVIALHPPGRAQIKSAIGNRGTYDPNDPDITKAEGGSATKRALMIARDQRALLRRIANIYPGPGGGMDPSPGGGGYSGPGGGKYIGPSHYAEGGKVPPFKLHSGAAKIIGAKGQKKATPQQYAAMPGIKPDELKHSKFDTLGSKALPREEVIKHLEDNAVPLEETQLGGAGRNTATKFEGYQLPGGENYREVLLHTPDAGSEDFQKRHAAARKAKADTFEHVKNMLDVHGYGDHPELLAAQQAYVNANMEFSKLQDEITERERARYRSGHWDVPNVLAHLRMSDRKGPNGEKVLHLEEVQSDWGQQGRKRGFQQPARQLTPAEDTELAELFDRVPEMRNGSPEIARYNELRNIARGQVANAQGLPSAPYVDNTQKWTDLALKRVLHEAAHGGYDKIVVTPGAEQNKRYPEYEGDLRPYYDNILPKRLQALAQQHDPQAKVNLHAHDLAAKPSDPFEEHKQHYADSYQAFEGQPHANDAELRNWARDFSPDDFHGVDDDPVKAAPLHSLDVTPQMRDSIKGNGFNSFKRGGDVGMRQRYADGGGADSPVVSRALDLTSLAQPRSPIAQAQSTLRNITTQPTEVGKTSVKSLSDAFDKGISEHLALKPADRIANSKRAADSLGAHIGRLQTGRPVPLLSKNAKLLKSETGYGDEEPVQLPDGRGVETVGLALAPAYEEGKFTTCPNSASCKAECLGKTSGNYFKVGGGKDLSAFKGPRLNSLKKTIGMLRDPENFAVRLNDEIESAKREAAMNGNHLGIRLNVLSDLNPRIHKAIIENHPDVTFYDYTKNNTNPIAPNHHYTYSSTGVSQDGVDNPHSNWKQMRKRLDTGSNVAMAFSDREHLPEMVHDEETGKHYKVVNGDKHDFRPLDIQPRGADGVIVGLKNKKATGTTANAHVESKGFFVKYDPQLQKNANGTYVRGESVGLRKDGKPMLGATIPTNRIVTIKSQRAAPALKTNDAGGGK